MEHFGQNRTYNWTAVFALSMNKTEICIIEDKAKLDKTENLGQKLPLQISRQNRMGNLRLAFMRADGVQTDLDSPHHAEHKYLQFVKKKFWQLLKKFCYNIAILQCSCAGCSVTAKCSILKDPEGTSRQNVPVYVCGAGKQNHSICVQEQMVVREQPKKKRFQSFITTNSTIAQYIDFKMLMYIILHLCAHF